MIQFIILIALILIPVLASNKSSKTSKGSLRCPNCGNTKWYEGAGGGSYGNIECGKCNKKYNNLGMFGLEEI